MFDDNNKPALPNQGGPQPNTAPVEKEPVIKPIAQTAGPVTPQPAVLEETIASDPNISSSSPANGGDSKEELSPDRPENPIKVVKEPEDIFSKTEQVKESQPEPIIKSPASGFFPKENLEPLSGVEVKQPLTKKNLILFITFLTVVLLAAAAVIWFLNSRSGKQPVTNPAVVELFDQMGVNADIKSQQPASSTASRPSAGQSPQFPVASTVSDADGDGLSDEEEIVFGTSINSSDTDNDGLYDREEIKVYLTDPLLADTDHDGWSDGDEIKNNQDPLTPDPAPPTENFYRNSQLKFEFEYLDNMVLEHESQNLVRFNDNINQIKLYIYLHNTQPSNLAPDYTYYITEQGNGQLIVTSSQKNADQTPYSTDLSTNSYHSNNNNYYLIRYVATKRAPDHRQKFERILNSFKFLK